VRPQLEAAAVLANALNAATAAHAASRIILCESAGLWQKMLQQLKGVCVLFAGELFAECPLPADGTPLTTVSIELLQGTRTSSCSRTQ
jgi:hypothetical protein